MIKISRVMDIQAEKMHTEKYKMENLNVKVAIVKRTILGLRRKMLKLER
jgi:hypothetical protein